VRVLAWPEYADVLPACSGVTHHGSEGALPLADDSSHHGSGGIVPSVAPRERDAFALWQTAHSGNEHRRTAHRVLPDGISHNQRQSRPRPCNDPAAQVEHLAISGAAQQIGGDATAVAGATDSDDGRIFRNAAQFAR